MSNIILKDECYQVIGACMEVYNQLGPGFLEVVYKDALEYEFNNRGIEYKREQTFKVNYKDIILPHKFRADFVVMDSIILELKAVNKIPKEFTAQCINYLKASNNQLALLVNFGEDRLFYKRIVY